jgi:F0F1-type ATP synthase epsilon subunit
MSGEDGTRPGPLPGMPGAQGPSLPAGSLSSAVTTTTGGGGFSVDLDHVPQAIADLREAARVLRDEADNAWNLANIRPPGLDEVSADAVRIMADAAVGVQGSLRLALEGAAKRLERDAEKLEAQLRTFRQADETSIPTARKLSFRTQS